MYHPTIGVVFALAICILANVILARPLSSTSLRDISSSTLWSRQVQNNPTDPVANSSTATSFYLATQGLQQAFPGHPFILPNDGIVAFKYDPILEDITTEMELADLLIGVKDVYSYYNSFKYVM
jgi:hypothetical protein